MIAPPDELLAAGEFATPAVGAAPAVGWEAFTDLGFIAQAVLILVIAVVLAAIIAYHPVLRRKATTLEEIEQPKTLIMYALVGALIAVIVKVQPNMALVVFGIGGLLRFRTNVGEAKDTGRVILVTVIGLCCGLELYVVAVLATVLSWLLIVVLERSSVNRVVIQGLEKADFAAAAEAYSGALRELGCTVIAEDKRVKKGGGTLTLTYRAPAGLDRGHTEQRFAEIPEDRRGAISWEL